MTPTIRRCTWPTLCQGLYWQIAKGAGIEVGERLTDLWLNKRKKAIQIIKNDGKWIVPVNAIIDRERNEEYYNSLDKYTLSSQVNESNYVHHFDRSNVNVESDTHFTEHLLLNIFTCLNSTLLSTKSLHPIKIPHCIYTYIPQYNSYFTEQEISLHVNATPNDKSPGSDGVTYEDIISNWGNLDPRPIHNLP